MHIKKIIQALYYVIILFLLLIACFLFRLLSVFLGYNPIRWCIEKMEQIGEKLEAI